MVIRFKYVLASVIVVVFLFVFRAVFVASRHPRDTFVVGMMSGWAPFMTVDPSGEYRGFDVDVAQKIADKLGKKLEVKDFGALATLLVGLQQNKVDCIMSGLDITTKRLQAMDMVAYTGTAVKVFYLLFWQALPKNIATIEDLQEMNDVVICAEPGSPHALFLGQFGFITCKSLSKIEDMVLDIKYGKSLAMIVEPQVGERLLKKTPELKKLEVPIAKEFQTFGMGIGFAKNSAFAKKVTEIIGAMRTDSTLENLEQKWQLYDGRQL